MKSLAGASPEHPVPSEAVTGGGRASKKQIITDTELRSSAAVVLSNDDLLIEILLRLPVIAIHLFKFVSKRWLSLITNPNFTLRLSQIHNIDPPSGLFLRRPNLTFRYDFVPLDTRIPANRLRLTFGSEVTAGNIEILQSCNGLLLCCINHNKYYIYNPSINRFKILPQRHDLYGIYIFGGMKMAFDPRKSPHYKVVHAGDYGAIMRIQTYSSETGNWSVFDCQFPLVNFIGFDHGIYYNNAIHWLDRANGASHYKLDVEHEHEHEPPLLTTIQTPAAMDGKLHYDCKLFESRGCLLLAFVVQNHSQQLNVYEMRNGYSEWSVKYLVNLDDVIMLYPHTSRLSRKPFCFTLRCIVLGEREEDSFLVMERVGKIVEYKIVFKTLREIYDLESVGRFVTRPAKFGTFQFIASFAGV